MTKAKVVFITLILVAGLGFGASLFAHHKGTVAVDTPYVTLMSGTDERLDTVNKGAYNLYRFSVVTDGRPYTIVVEPVSGRPELYASRYKPDVDELVDILSWWCDDDHCGQAATYDGFQTFTFDAPVGGSEYHSWFSVYGDTASQYRLKVVNQRNIVRAAAVALPATPATEPVVNSNTATENTNFLTWVASPGVEGTYIYPDSNNNNWYSLSYNVPNWIPVQLPDDSSLEQGSSRFYRGKFRADNPDQDLYIEFASDDGMELYVNSQLVGSWGGAYGSQMGCVNMSCPTNKDIAPINVRPYLRSGENLIAARVYNGYMGTYFDLHFK